MLPIDRAITALRHSNRVPRLRPEEVLDARIIACPYYAARYATAMAVDAATVAAGDDPVDMARRWRAHEHAARDARASIAAIAQSLVLAAEVPCTRWPLLEPDEVTHRAGDRQRSSREMRGPPVNLLIEIECEDDGRWIAEVPELPGVMVYGQTREDAISRVQALALRVIADRLENGEMAPAIDQIFSVMV